MGNRVFFCFVNLRWLFICASAYEIVIITLSPSEASGESAHTYMQLQAVFGRANAAIVYAHSEPAFMLPRSAYWSGKLLYKICLNWYFHI